MFCIRERFFGEGQTIPNFVGLTLGTGLGGGIIQQGKLLDDANCGSGEFGEIPYKEHNLEYYCSGSYFMNVLMNTDSLHAFGQFHQQICTAGHILLVAHKKYGDTLGSSSSVLNWLLREGKDVTVFCADVPPEGFRYIDNIHRYTNDPVVFERTYDLVVVFDSGDLRYCGVADHFQNSPGYFLVNIDHHVTNEQFGHLNLVFTMQARPQKSSIGSTVTRSLLIRA